MRVLLKTPETMFKRIVDWMDVHGHNVNDKQDSLAITFEDEGVIRLSVQYHKDIPYSITVDGINTFTLEDGDIYCVEGTANILLKAYEYCEDHKA